MIQNIYRTFLFLLLLIPVLGSAQEKLDCSVVSFAIDPFSTTAQDRRYEMIDGNGDRYAIIKVKDIDGEADLNGFTFNFGTLNSIIKSHSDELWVYVQRNAKTVTIKHPEYKTIEKYDLNTTIQPGKTYIMQLTLSRVQKSIVRNVKKQVLQFKVSPANEKAVVKVKKAGEKGEFELWGEVDAAGTIDKMLDFGSYDYIVTALNYESSTGRVTLSNSRTTCVEQIVLRPNFGFLEIDGNNGATGAQIYVDDVKIGTVPYSEPDRRWKCGSHKITIKNGDLYKPYNSTFIIKQGDITKISPKLESDFAQTTIKVDGDAEIILDGKSKGNGSWTGPLKAGQYTVVCRKDNHRESSRMLIVKPDVAETFSIPAPSPITGNVYVRSTPSGAEITIDGEKKGATPSLLQGIIIGSHVVKLTLANHKTEQFEIVVKEDRTEDLNAKLSDMAYMTIDSKPSNSILYINGEKVGVTPYSNNMASGDYNITIKKNKFRDFSQRVHLDSSNPSMTINLEGQYQRPYSFYIQPGFKVGSALSIGVQVGAYISNINIEGYYMLGLNKSEMIYWNATSSDVKPCGYSYKAAQMGIRLGYGIVFGTRMRLTPQVGFGVAKLSSAESYNIDPSFDASNTYAANSSISAKFEYAVASCFGVYIAPEYSFAVKKGDYYKDMESISNKIKGFASGANVNLGISLFF